MKNTLLDKRTENNWDQMLTFIPVDTSPQKRESDNLFHKLIIKF